MSNYRINSQDPVATWNLHILKTKEQFEVMPELKDNGLTIDWASENGTERYHGLKRFKSKTYNIPCAILCTTESEYQIKLEAFKTFLLTAGEFNLDVLDKGRRYKVSYLNMSDYQRFGASATFTLILADDHPTEVFTI